MPADNAKPPAPADTELLLLRYHEIALKGENRSVFEERLAINARKLLARELGPEHVEVHRQHGRVLVRVPRDERLRVSAVLQRLFGYNSYSIVRTVPTAYEDLTRAAIEEFDHWVGRHGMPKTFRVATRRSDKVLPQPSHEIDRIIGGEVADRYPSVEVNLKQADLTIGIEIRKGESFIWSDRIPTQGGLPVGANGRALCLLSGGLDSPVAAIQILRRGSPCSLLHFYGTPFVGEEALEKVEDLARLINSFQPDAQPLLVIPFGKIQERIALATQPRYRTILYRRMMMRIASKVAVTHKAQALVTGESLGQVASQTLENLACIDAASALPILRPLIAHDKDEIVAQAQRWGTFETSIRPAIDCCTLFADRHPATRATPELIASEEVKFPVEELVQQAIEGLFLVRGQPLQRR